MWWANARPLYGKMVRKDSRWFRRVCSECQARTVTVEVDLDRRHEHAIWQCPACHLERGKVRSHTTRDQLTQRQKMNCGADWRLWLRLGIRRYYECSCGCRWRTLEIVPGQELSRGLAPVAVTCECGGKRHGRTELRLDKKQKALVLSILRRNEEMPIYTYKVGGDREIEVFESAQTPPAKTLAGIDPETIIAGDVQGLEPNTPVERQPTAPGGFRGLPTPKFHA